MPDYGDKSFVLKINAERATEALKLRIGRGIRRCAEETKVQIQRNISIPTRSAGPSAEGEMPHADTGRLRNSIFWRMVGELTAVIGTNLNYGIWLEYGVAGEKTVHAQPGKVFHWIDRATGQDVFAKSFTFRGLKPRPFMRPTLHQMYPRVAQIIKNASGGAATVSEA